MQTERERPELETDKLEEDLSTALDRMAVVLVHQPDCPMPDRKSQSSNTRLLLKLALKAARISVPARLLGLSGTGLVQSIREHSGLEISLSHCPRMLVIALGREKLGVDCEARGRARNWPGIARQFFTPSEAAVIAATPPGEVEQVFLRHWTLKEAYVKANGGSIFGDLNKLTVGSRSAAHDQGEDGERWQAWHSVVGNCGISVCIARESTYPPRLFNCADLSGGALQPWSQRHPFIRERTCRFQHYRDQLESQ